MNANFKVSKPGEIVFTATLSAPLREWEAISKALEGNTDSPMWEIRQRIRDLVNQAHQIFYPEPEQSDQKPAEKA